MFDAFADRQDRRVAGHHLVVDQYRAMDGEPCLFCKPHIRTDTRRHHHQAGRNGAPVGQTYALDLALSKDFRCVRACQDGLTATLQRGLKQPARRFIKLALHQRIHQVNNGDLHTPQGEPMGRLQAKQATADHHGIPPLGGRVNHHVDIRHIAERDDARQILARHGNDERVRSGRDQ